MNIEIELEEAKKRQAEVVNQINELANQINERTEQRQQLIQEAHRMEGEIRGFIRLASKKD